MSKVDILDLYKSIFLHNKRKAFSYEGECSPYLKEYRRNHSRHAKRCFSQSNLNDLLQSIRSSRVIFLGDFHTFTENSKNLERLLRTIEKDDFFSLGVEFINFKHQDKIDLYLQKKISEKDFLKAVNYQKSWMFPWKQYRKFFELAKHSNLKIIALNSNGNLSQRDKKASKIIVNFLRSNPQSKMIILFGEYHIVPNKLPKEVEQESSGLLQQTIIHQNLDDVFWNLQQNHLNEQVIRFSSNEFSLQTSPPWIKYESMIYWYENLPSFSKLSLSEQLEKYSPSLSGNEQERFLYLCKQILHALDFNIQEEDLHDFNLYGHTKLSFILKKLEKIKENPLRNFFISLIKRGKTFKLPFTNDYYCSDYSFNRLTFLAGSHIHNILLKYRNIDLDKILPGSNQTQRFLLLFHQSLMSYFASKVINPYLKCDRYQDLIRKSRSTKQTKSKRSALKLAIKIINRKDHLHEIIKGKNLRILQSSAKAVGNLMAENLFERFFQKSPRSFQALKILILNTHYEIDEFNNLLDILLPYNEYKNQKKRFL